MNMLRTTLFGVLLVAVDGTIVTTPTAKPYTLVAGSAQKSLTVTFTTSATGAALQPTGTITIISDQDLFTTNPTPTPISITSGGTDTLICTTSAIAATTKQVVVTLQGGADCTIAANTAVKVVLGADTNANTNGFSATNPAAGGQVKITMKTSSDQDETAAIAATTWTTVAAPNSVKTPSVSPNAYAVGKAVGTLTFVFTAATVVPGGNNAIIIKNTNAAAKALFTTTSIPVLTLTTCTPAPIATFDTDGNLQVATGTCKLIAGTAYTLVVTNNLNSNPAAAGDVTFTIQTSTDTSPADVKYPAVTLTVTPGSNVVGKPVEKLTFVFTPTAAVTAANNAITIKGTNAAAQAVLTLQATAFSVTMSPCDNANTKATSTTGANAAIAITPGCNLVARTQYTFTVSTNLANNPTTAGDVTFSIETTADATPVAGSYQAVASVTAYTVTPNSLVTSAKLSSLAFKFTPTGTVAAATNNGVTIKTASAIWTAQSTAFSITIAPACANADVKATTALAAGTTPAQMQITSSCELTAGTSYTLTVTSNLGSNPSTPGDVKLSLQTTTDTTPVDATYTVANVPSSPFSTSPGTSNTTPNPQSPTPSASPALTPSFVLLLIALVPFLKL